jgi:hypothetical protein
MRAARRLAATAFLVLGFFFVSSLACGPVRAQQSTPPTQIALIDPPVPHPAGQPCVVELFNNQPWPQELVEVVYNPVYSYTPPVACPPPWSKVVLKLDIRSNRRSVLDTFGMDLANVRLFRSATPRFGSSNDSNPFYWHVERDLTDYSALFTAPQTGSLWDTQDPDAIDYGSFTDFAFYGTAELVFYPPTAAAPPPKVPDVVIAANQGPLTLPHNVVRAYLDTENDPGNEYWYTCASNDSGNFPLGDIAAPGETPEYLSIFPLAQGCGGGSFQEIQVSVDGTLAGIAPAFPLVMADVSWLDTNNADQPITTPEMLNFKPFRIDLTPFAGVLSAAGSHNISAGNDDAGGGGATLLLYLDPHQSQVTGAVTVNTLANENGAATDVDTLKAVGEATVGDITTQQHRNFEIRGFVNTSQGRVESSVAQIDDFINTQHYHLEGPQYPPLPPSDDEGVPTNKLYEEHVWLTDSVQQTSTRAIGSRVISWDRTNTQYPLDFLYSMATVMTNEGDAFYVNVQRTNVTVTQGRIVDGDHIQGSQEHLSAPLYFTTHAASGFHSVNRSGPNALWQSSTTRDYSDNFGSCYRVAMNADNGTITSREEGEGCPGGRDWVIWFAHPDGSPDNLDWQD